MTLGGLWGCMYGWPEVGQLYKTWSLLCEFDGPILLRCDFNEILSMSEIGRGLFFMGILEIRWKGAIFVTLVFLAYGILGSGAVIHILVFGNGLTVTLLRRVGVRTSPMHMWRLRYKSDHTPIMLQLQGYHRNQKKRKKSFHFETTWLLNDECEPLVRSV